jgi:tRNA wybutosine-synthesizing protein 1
VVVQAWNDDEVHNYAKLLELGNPDFIEVKGVTFCGDSKASTLTMNNVPWHEEVITFVNELVALSPGYVRTSTTGCLCSLLLARALKM